MLIINFQDTAQVNENEAYIGDSLSVLLEKHRFSRDVCYITTKIGNKKLKRF